MAKKAKRRKASSPNSKGERLPTQAVANPVVNSPYEQPKRHWVYQVGEGEPYLMDGRRSASYFYKTKKTGTTQDGLFRDEQSDELPLVNRLRHDVERWRGSNYRGATPATRDLLIYWVPISY
ncbi:MAG: hypothetical protein JKY65_01800 [Planctomycetes bacterium]|nr:hypothetical protein [Planctomycetota bacterium]